MEGAGSGRNNVEDRCHYDQSVSVIEAVQDDDGICLYSSLDWVLFMTSMCCIFEIHSDQGMMYFMTRGHHQIANSDIEEGISICRNYQSD